MTNDREYVRAYNKAIDLISYREHFVKELESKLIQRNFDLDTVHLVISDLISKNLLNNLRAGQIYLESKKYKYGRLRLEHMLREKGLQSFEIEVLLAEIDVDDRQKLKDLVNQKKYESNMKPPYTEKDLAKLARFADSRGFSSAVIYEMIGSLRSERIVENEC